MSRSRRETDVVLRAALAMPHPVQRGMIALGDYLLRRWRWLRRTA
jgi:hypothetical protein